MDEQTHEGAPASRSLRWWNLPRWVRWTVCILGLVLFLMVQNAVSCTKVNRMQRDTFSQGVQALAIALSTPLSEAIGGPEGQARLENLLKKVATEGDYALIILTDQQGKVIATTDRRFEDQVVRELAREQRTARVSSPGTRLRADCSVYAMQSRQGGLRVEMEARR